MPALFRVGINLKRKVMYSSYFSKLLDELLVLVPIYATKIDNILT